MHGGGEKKGGEGGEDSKETIFFCSNEPIKALCLQYSALSAEKVGLFDFHRGGLSGMDGERSGWQTEEEMEGRREVSVMWRQPQWMRLAVMAALVLVVWLAAPADMDKHRGTGGFSGAKQPQGSANEGTSLVSLHGLI